MAVAVVVAALLAAAALPQGAFGLDNGLALTPPMGWMAWQRFRCVTDCKTYPDGCVDHKNIYDQGNLLVSAGYTAVGYNSIHIDDCYMGMKRNETTGKLYGDPARFPRGVRGLSDDIHKLGLKFALYEDIGTHTCAGYPGDLDHFEIDVDTFVNDWKGDYLKLDGCYVANVSDYQKLYIQFGEVLNKSGVPMVYSCSWPAYLPESEKPKQYAAMQKHCNLWRNYGDIQDSWDSLRDIANYWGDNQDVLVKYAGPGSWNDPDMLLIGNNGLSEDQSQFQMAIWAIIAAPLIMGNDLRVVKDWQRDILQNVEIIAVNQDRAGIQGRRVTDKGNFETWVRPLANKDLAIALVNKCDSCGPPMVVTATFKQIGTDAPRLWCRDLYQHKELGVFEDKIALYVNGGGGVRMLRCRNHE